MDKDLIFFFEYVRNNMQNGSVLKKENDGYYLYGDSLLLAKCDRKGLKIYYTKEK